MKNIFKNIKSMKKSLFLLAPLALFSILTASSLAATSGTATYTFTLPAPQLGVSVVAPASQTISNLYNYGSVNTFAMPLKVSNTGTENEYLNLSVGTMPAGLTLYDSNAGMTSTVTGAVYSSNFSAGQAEVYFSSDQSGSVETAPLGFPCYALSQSNVDLGTSNPNASSVTSAAYLPVSSGITDYLAFAVGVGTVGGTYSIPINVSVSAN